MRKIAGIFGKKKGSKKALQSHDAAAATLIHTAPETAQVIATTAPQQQQQQQANLDANGLPIAVSGIDFEPPLPKHVK